MECPNCTFQNMPGLKSCGRCACPLDLSGISVDPPRRADHPIRGAMGDIFRPLTRRAAVGIERVWNRPRRSRSILGEIDGGAFVRTLFVPGWGHRHLGIVPFGWLATGVWAALFVIALWLRGSFWELWSYFALVGWHSFIASLVMARALRSAGMLSRIGYGLAVYALINICLYLPFFWVQARTVRMIELNNIRGTAEVANGDRLLLEGRLLLRRRPLERGDVIVYPLRAAWIGYAAQPGAHGAGVDRILAVGGDRFEMDGQGLRVNGVPIPRELGPLGEAGFPPDVIEVPMGSVLVLPSTAQIRLAGAYAEVADYLQQIVRTSWIVPEDQVLGRVLYRVGPIGRMGRPGYLRDADAAERDGS